MLKSWKQTFAKFEVSRSFALVGAFYKGKVLVGAFSIIVKTSRTFVSCSNLLRIVPYLRFVNNYRYHYLLILDSMQNCRYLNI